MKAISHNNGAEPQSNNSEPTCKKSLNFSAGVGVKPTTTTTPQPAATFPPIILLGPTTVGKTEVAFGLAHRLNAEVFNADKFYLYDALPEVTGQSDADQYPEITSHLYGQLQPDEPLWSQCRYNDELRRCFLAARQRNRNTIVEGCSHALIRTAIETLHSAARSEAETPLLIGLRWKRISQLSADCERRAAKMMCSGMLTSFRQAADEGMGETYLLRKCFAREPLLACRRGVLNQRRCQSRVAELLERHARRHYERMGRIRGVTWIDHDRSTPEATIERIRLLLNR